MVASRRRVAALLLPFLAVYGSIQLTKGHAAPVKEPDGLAWRDPAPQAPEDDPLPKQATARLGRFVAPTTLHAVSPDGKYLATTHRDGFAQAVQYPIHLWDARTGKHLRVLEGHPVGVLSAAFAPDGGLLATGGMDNTLRFWDTATGKQLGNSEPHAGHVYAVLFTPDGKQVISTSNEVRLWDAAERREIRNFTRRGKPEFFFEAALSPDGKTLATGSEQHIRLWSVPDGKELHTLKEKITAHRNRLAFSDDGKTLLGNGWPKGVLRKWSVAEGRIIYESDKQPVPPETVRFAPDGRRMAWVALQRPNANTARTLIVADTDGGKEICRIESPSQIRSFLFGGDGKTLTLSGSDGSLHVWDATTGKFVRPLLEASHPVAALWYNGGTKSLVALTRDYSLHEWDAEQAKERRQCPLAIQAKDWPIRVAPDGKLLATADKDGTLGMWDFTTGKELWSAEKALRLREPPLQFGPGGPFPLPPPPAPGAGPPARAAALPPPPPPPVRREPMAEDVLLGFSPGGKLLAGRTGDGKQITLWEAATGKKREQVKSEAFVESLALSGDGKTLYFSHDGNLRDGAPFAPGMPPPSLFRVWNLAADKEVRVVKLPALKAKDGFAILGNVAAFLPAPDGKTLAVVEKVVTINLLAPGLPGHPRPSTTAWRVYLWDTDGKKEPQLLSEEGSRLITFSPDGKRLAFARDKGIAVWDAASGELLKPEGGHRAAVTALGFLPDNRTLASGSEDGTILLWDLVK